MQRYESRHQAHARCTRGDLKPDHGPDPKDASEWFGRDSNSEEYEQQRLGEEEEVLFLSAIAEGKLEGVRAARLMRCPGYFDDQIRSFEVETDIDRWLALAEEPCEIEFDPEVGGLTTVLIIEDIERETFQGLTA